MHNITETLRGEQDVMADGFPVQERQLHSGEVEQGYDPFLP